MWAVFESPARIVVETKGVNRGLQKYPPDPPVPPRVKVAQMRNNIATLSVSHSPM